MNWMYNVGVLVFDMISNNTKNSDFYLQSSFAFYRMVYLALKSNHTEKIIIKFSESSWEILFANATFFLCLSLILANIQHTYIPNSL